MGEYNLIDEISELSSDIFRLNKTMLLLVNSVEKLVEAMQNKTEQHSEN